MHDEEVEVETIADDAHLWSPSFKQWLTNMSAQNSMLQIVLKLAETVDHTDGDDEFEDCDFEGDTDRVIDLD